jgi:hypothetical protein
MATDPRQIQLTPEQQRQVALLADQSGKPWPDLLAEALSLHVPTVRDLHANGTESLCDALKADGYLAAAIGGPHDKSTNLKYMEGFGQSQ